MSHFVAGSSDPISSVRLNKSYQQTPTGTQFVLVVQELHHVRGGALGDKSWRQSINICVSFAIGPYRWGGGEYFLLFFTLHIKPIDFKLTHVVQLWRFCKRDQIQ